MSTTASSRRNTWPSWAALAVLLVISLLDTGYWIWGVFFLWWSIRGVIAREAFVVQIVRQDENPVLFWCITISWMGLSALWIVYDLTGGL